MIIYCYSCIIKYIHKESMSLANVCEIKGTKASMMQTINRKERDKKTTALFKIIETTEDKYNITSTK